MAVSDRSTYTADDGNWQHSANVVVAIGDEFSTYQDIVKYTESTIAAGSAATPATDPDVLEALSAMALDDPEYTAFTTIGKCRDTTLGGNDAINCLPAFCENDDIVYDFYKTPMGTTGMGRAYAEFYDNNAQILWMTAGNYQYSSVAGFYANIMDTNLVDLMTKGPSFINFEKIGTLLGGVAGDLILLPVISLMFFNRLIGNLSKTPITKYCDFRAQMPLYYRFTNTIIAIFGTNLGFKDNDRLDATKRAQVNDPTATGSTTSDATYSQLEAGAAISAPDATPDWVRVDQLDIWRILLRKSQYEKGKKTIPNYSVDYALKRAADAGAAEAQAWKNAVYGLVTGDAEGAAANATQGGVYTMDDGTGKSTETTWTDSMINSFHDIFDLYESSLYDAMLYVGFRVERGVDTTYSFNNSTGPSDVKNAINSGMQTARQSLFSVMGGKVVDMGAIGSILGAIVKPIADVGKGFVNGLGVGGLVGAATGSAMVDIPDMWTDSSFSKSYNFSIKLRPIGGDPYTVMQMGYVPLAMLLPFGIPRSVGPNAYVAPFNCRMYLKGQVACPFGMVENMSIRHGGDNFGLTAGRLPKEIDIDFSVKDLSPVMHMALGEGNGLYDAILGENSIFQEYLATLTGMGMRERLTQYQRIMRKFSILRKIVLQNTLSPMAAAVTVGNSTLSPAHMLIRLLPTTKMVPD